MKVLVAEYLCGGGMLATPVEAIPASLCREGIAMWQAIVEDLAEWAQVVTPIDSRLNLPQELADVDYVEMKSSPTPWPQWLELAGTCEAAIVIAPETDGLLIQAITMLRSTGVTVLAPGNETLRTACDKWLTAKRLHEESIAHPISLLGSQVRANENTRLIEQLRNADAWITKPRDGCGSMGVHCHNDFDTAYESLGDNELLQSKLTGRSASTLVITDSSGSVNTILPGVWQQLDESMQYVGGHGPADMESQRRMHALAERVLSALPGKLTGFLGIDMLLGEDANHDTVIEINPRLTTSYIGLRRMFSENLTRRLVVPLRSSPITAVNDDSIHWDASGEVDCVAATSRTSAGFPV